jgi:hypothetical protein
VRVRVLYIGRFEAAGNDDENAVAHALETLGHEVVRLHEAKGRFAPRFLPADFVLFNKWNDPDTLGRLRVPKVFWWWDLVDFPDPLLRTRCLARVQWMERTTPLVDLGFLSDGDWVSRDRTGKLVRLTQGADARVAGKGNPDSGPPVPVLFTGIRAGGRARLSFVDDLRARYGDAFRHVERGVHGRALADLIARAQVVVAPDGPVTDGYASNRVYLTLGFGGFLLHPYSAGLTGQYEGGKELVYYRSRGELFDLIDYYLDRPAERKAIADAGLARTLAEHTYTERCRRLIEVVKERLRL